MELKKIYAVDCISSVDALVIMAISLNTGSNIAIPVSPYSKLSTNETGDAQSAGIVEYSDSISAEV